MRLTSLLFAAVLLAARFSFAADADPVMMSYGASTAGTAVYTVVVAQSSILNNAIPGLQISAEVSGGGVDNLRFMEDDVFQISQGANISVWQAVNGEGEFADGKLERIRGFMPIYPSFVHVVVRKDSGIDTLEDLRGKRISVGIKSSGGEVIAQAFFAGIGLPYEDFEPYYLSSGESNDGLKEGSLDALFYASGIPMPAVMELNAVEDVKLIPIGQSAIDKIVSTYPFFSAGMIPGNTYDGMPDDFPTVQGFTVGFIRDSVPEELVYQMAKTLWENKDELARVHSSQNDLNPDMIRNGIVPVIELHPGAARYYREQGWIE